MSKKNNLSGNSREFFGKIIFKGKLVLITGLHIGSSRDVSTIGGVDNPVIRDPITNEPIIPGSSLKGKLRSLAELILGKQLENRGSESNPIRRHECKTNQDAYNCEVCRIFGSSRDENFPARIIVRDLFLTEKSKAILEELDSDLYMTELKSENSIDRITAAADTRSIERVPAGTEFNLEIIYNIENEQQKDDDVKMIKHLLKLLEDDYLGGSGSRGYGKIKFILDKDGIEKSRDDYIEISN